MLTFAQPNKLSLEYASLLIALLICSFQRLLLHLYCHPNPSSPKKRLLSIPLGFGLNSPSSCGGLPAVASLATARFARAGGCAGVHELARSRPVEDGGSGQQDENVLPMATTTGDTVGRGWSESSDRRP